MSRSLSDQLIRTLSDRSNAFRSHVRALRIDNTGAPQPLRDSLALVELYTTCLVEHITSRLAGAMTEFDRQNELKLGLANLREKEFTIDRMFTRSGNSSLPRSLIRRVRKEFDSLELDLRPVVSVGGPGTFEAYEEDLRGFLFHDLWSIDYPGFPEYQQSKLAVITVPYLEGTRAFWEPLVLGHEVGHIAIYYKGHLNELGNRGLRNDYLVTNARSLGLAEDSEMTLNWLAEIMCDLNMCRLYGPAAICALADMLTVSNNTQDPRLVQASTHPPNALRLEIALRAVGDIDETDLLGSVVAPWRGLADERALDNLAVQAVEELQNVDVCNAIWDEVRTWGLFCYQYDRRRNGVNWIANRIAWGRPGGLWEEACDVVDSDQAEFLPQDVVNAAWATRDGGSRPIGSTTCRGRIRQVGT